MKKFCSIVILVLLTFVEVNSQNLVPRIQKDDIENLDNRISKLFYKSKCCELENLKMIHIYNMTYDKMAKIEDFKNGDYINQIKYNYYKKWMRKYISAYSYICDENWNYIASSDGYIVFCASVYGLDYQKRGSNMVDLLCKHNINELIYINLFSIGVYFTVFQNSEPLIVIQEGDTVIIKPIKYLTSKEWHDITKIHSRHYSNE